MYNTIIVIDCYNIGHITFHAIGELDYHGRRTGIIYGFMLRLLNLSKIYNTINFIFAWDSQKSLRKLEYPTYKKREKNTVVKDTGEVIDYQAFQTQMEEIRNKILPQLGFNNSYLATGYEADDIMAAAVTRFPCDPSIKYILATTDKDLYQCLSDERVIIYNIRTKKQFTKADFTKIYDISPSLWVKAKAIGGCYSDTVTGIAGIADPAKSKKSRALAYLKNELKPTTEAYKSIINEHGKYIIERNIKLIKLPYRNLTLPEPRLDTLDKNKFLTMFDNLGFASFLKGDNRLHWENFFNQIR